MINVVNDRLRVEHPLMVGPSMQKVGGRNSMTRQTRCNKTVFEGSAASQAFEWDIEVTVEIARGCADNHVLVGSFCLLLPCLRAPGWGVPGFLAGLALSFVGCFLKIQDILN